jgi:predicted nicotinamide N-methyase
VTRTKAREVAWWAGLAAFFGNLVGLKVLELISGDDWAQIAAAVVVSAIVGAAVYSKERLQAARGRRNGNGNGLGPPPG